mgnify:CR=1 FL=1
MDLPHRTEHVHQLYPQRKEHPRNRHPHPKKPTGLKKPDETQAMLRQLYRMINRLGQLEKSIILLYLEEKSYEEIAEITGLTLTNVATKLSRIKDKLKKMNKEE